MQIRTVLFVGVFLLGSTLNTGAQYSTMKFGTKGELQKWLPPPLGKKGVNQNCGPYFASYDFQKRTGEKVEIVAFVFNSVDKIGRKQTAIPQINVDQIEVRVVKELKTPTVKVLYPGSPVKSWVEISISPGDLKLSPCLKHSKVVT